MVRTYVSALTRAMSDPRTTFASMLIDCDTCEVRGKACADCFVTFLTIGVRPAEPAPLESAVELDSDVSAAVNALAAGGLVPPLRLVERRAV